MNKVTITRMLNRIETAGRANFHYEALFLCIQLNMRLLEELADRLIPGQENRDVKPKKLIAQLTLASKTDQGIRSIIQPKQLKLLKVWAERTDTYLKALRYRIPPGSDHLKQECIRAFHILHMAYTKKARNNA